MNLLRLLLLGSTSALALSLPGQDAEDDVFSQAELEALTAEIRSEIEELRGQEFDEPVAVHVTDKEGLLDYVKARMEKTTTEEEIREEATLSKLLGLMPADMDYLGTMERMLEEQVGGFYDPDADAFYLMESYTGDLARVILAHELVHALDDQLYGIDSILETREENGDASWAFHAVVEGSATVLMTKWMVAHMGEIDMEAASKGQGPDTASLRDVPAVMWKPLLGSYLVGSAFLARTENMMSAQIKQVGEGIPTADIETTFLEPPRSSEQVLHPEKYWDAAQLDEPVVVTLGTDALPEGWSVSLEDTFGELGLALLTGSEEDRGGLEMPEDPMAAGMKLLTVAYTNPAAAGWGGDRYVLLRRDGARLFHLVTEWDSAGEAREFHAALAARVPSFQESAAAVASEMSVEGSGVELAEPLGTRVVLTAWIGTDADGARSVAAELGG